MMRHDGLMPAVEIVAPGGPEALVPTLRPRPIPSEHEILIEVFAAGVNRPDVFQRRGLYPPPPGASDIPGLEVAGTVAACGAGVSRWRVGDAVTALVTGGGYAGFCVAHEEVALPIPKGMPFTAAAALPETFFTVWHNVFMRGRLTDDDVFLVHGGTSGIGTTAIQLASTFGARVIATAGSDAKCRACRDLGAHEAINYRTADFVAEVKRLTDGRGADLILDMVGAEYLARNYDAAAVEGRIVQISFMTGSSATVDFQPLMVKRLTHTGSTMRARSNADKAVIARALRETVWPLLERGLVAPVMDRVFPLADAADAHRRMEAGDHIGKIVLIVDPRAETVAV